MKHVFWFLDCVHGFVTERHIHSQAVREMNAHTVQHGSLGVFTFLYFVVFLLFCKPESIQHNPQIWVGGIYRSGSDGEEDVLERSLKVRIFPRKKQSPPVRSEIDAGSRGGGDVRGCCSLLAIWWKTKNKTDTGSDLSLQNALQSFNRWIIYKCLFYSLIF